MNDLEARITRLERTVRRQRVLGVGLAALVLLVAAAPPTVLRADTVYARRYLVADGSDIVAAFGMAQVHARDGTGVQREPGVFLFGKEPTIVVEKEADGIAMRANHGTVLVEGETVDHPGLWALSAQGFTKPSLLSLGAHLAKPPPPTVLPPKPPKPEEPAPPAEAK